MCLLVACVSCLYFREGLLETAYEVIAWLAMGLAVLAMRDDEHLALPGYVQAGIIAIIVLLGIGLRISMAWNRLTSRIFLA